MGTEYSRRARLQVGRPLERRWLQQSANQSLDAKGDLALAMAPEGQVLEIELPVHSESGRPREEAVKGDPRLNALKAMFCGCLSEI